MPGKVCIKHSSDPALALVQVMKMMMALLAPADGVVRFQVLEGSILSAGDLVARLELDDAGAVQVCGSMSAHNRSTCRWQAWVADPHTCACLCSCQHPHSALVCTTFGHAAATGFACVTRQTLP